uniref:A disintegrin and metalloproteinase with thrombospondin motifs 9 n=1 Tax=Cacopsylla melanoneura TaxID=428564 RepID=A0A8D8Q3J5_9HEMI
MTSNIASQKLACVVVLTGFFFVVLVVIFLWNGFLDNQTNTVSILATSIEVSSSPVRTLRHPASSYEERTAYDVGGLLSNASPADSKSSSKESAYSATEFSSADSSEKEVEYVQPVKIVPSHEGEDVAVEYREDVQQSGDSQPPVRHHSGQYRHQTAPVWDPHPEYEFQAFGQLFHINLELDSDFVHPNIQVTHVYKNTTERDVQPRFKSNGCFYSGSVQGDNLSSISVNLCNGMRGHIRTSTGNYVIEPVEKYNPDNLTRPILHKFYRIPPLNIGSTDHCGLDSHDITNESYDTDDSTYEPSDSDTTREYPRRYDPEENETVQFTPRVLMSDSDDVTDNLHMREKRFDDVTDGFRMSSRKKRSTESGQEFFIELMIVADRKMAEYHGAGLHAYVLTLMAQVSRIFKDASVGNSLTISVVKLYILNDLDLVTRRKDEAGIMSNLLLRKFCTWQHRMLSPNDSSRYHHHDTALLLTREKLCHENPNYPMERCTSNSTFVNGLAGVGRMCDSRNSCALVRDNGLSSAFTIAHELGHVLNMPHDESGSCFQHRNWESLKTNVMATSLDMNTSPWSWSDCSRHYLTEFLDSDKSECLKNEPTNDYLSDSTQHWPPGENFSVDRQCELLYGNGARLCKDMSVCANLWCSSSSAPNRCQSHAMPWADGTLCRGNTHWCQRGECVARDSDALLPRVGSWGSWQSFGSCSRPCGGGIKKSYRECNSPAPANGGKYCVGKRVRYKECNTWECPDGSLDFREEQCMRFNGNNFSLPTLSSDVKWTAKYLGGDKACTLYCSVINSSAYYPLRPKVIDGTPCQKGSFDMCVNGRCMKAGCDHVLDSDSTLDYCGVCQGNNRTCQQVSGTHNTSQHGYTMVVRIPSGSFNLDIMQYGYMGFSADDNYLALFDGETNDPILNGKFLAYKSAKEIKFGGITLNYTGTDSVDERINCSKPLSKDLVVKVLSSEGRYPPNIHYRYTVPRGAPDEYKWVLDNQWTRCSQVCNGESRREPVCIRVEDNVPELDHLCPLEDKPEPDTRPCNNHCVLKWQVISQSECSAHCGPGTRSVSLQCVQHFPSSPSTPPQPLYNSTCVHLPRPPEREPCEGPCNAARWKFEPWSTCSKTCGTGVETRTAVCIDDYEREVDESQCSASEKIIQRVCGTSKCPQWAVGEWSECSVSCGTGERKRPFWCQRDNHVVQGSYCASEPVPAHKDVCYMPPCPEWIVGQFSACSVTCGEGTATRDVHCNLGDETACSSLPKPPTVETCVVHPCDEHVQDNDIPGTRDLYDVLQDSPYTMWRTGTWTPCSASCGEGERKRRVECYDKQSGKQVDEGSCSVKTMPAARERCKLQPCASWRSSEWSACSVDCGQGLMRRKVQCVDTSNQDQVDERYCLDSHPVEDAPCYVTTGCGTPSQYTWRTSRWSECSAACGGGIRRRTVECYNELNQLGRTCEPGEKPESSGTCNEHPCVTGDWIYGGWSECNSTCGGGHQHRQVECQDRAGITLAESSCLSHTRPARDQKCNIQACTVHQQDNRGRQQYMWKPTPWTPCPKGCGEKVRTRKLVCVSIDTEQVEDPGKCRGLKTPKTERPCLKKTLCNIDWVGTAWSACSVRCGAGVQTRDFTCRRVRDNTSLPHYMCGSRTKPPAIRPCEMEPCDGSTVQYAWVPGPWQDCSHPCGEKGKQVRKLYCYNQDNKKVHRRLCEGHVKPVRKRMCNQKKCGLTSCTEVRSKLGTRQDGDYTLSVLGRNLSIYCYRMDTSEPREYISLHAEANNYAEKYDRRLLDPDTCPYQGYRDENCRCTNSASDSGITTFYRIRVNITSLRVNTKDFTFSRQRKGSPQPYGEAGDCYSRNKCPQGRFSIDLTGTGFMISGQTVWLSHGPYAAMVYNKLDGNRKVVGKCGGYCGHCAPSNGLKLDILPP